MFQHFRQRLHEKAPHPMNSYKVHIQRKGEDYPAYIIPVDAPDIESAKAAAITFLVENAWWPTCMTDKQKRDSLTAVFVETLTQ